MLVTGAIQGRDDHAVLIQNNIGIPVRLSVFDAKKGGLYPSYLPTSQHSEVINPGKSMSYSPEVADNFFLVVEMGAFQDRAPMLFSIPIGEYLLGKTKNNQVVIEPIMRS